MLEGIVRESIGKKASKALRRDGYLIANIYGKGLENVQAAFKINDFIKNSGRILVLPKVIDKETMIAIEDKNQYIISPFGNKEPNGEEYRGNIDVIITPGVAFDRNKNSMVFREKLYLKALTF